MHEFLSVVLEIGCYWIVRLLAPLLTFGRVEVQKIDTRESGFNRFGFKRNRNGTFLLKEKVATLIGALFWLTGLIAYFALIR